MRVSLNDVELYRGEVAQGCGNQIFDYCHKIPLVEQPITDSAESRRPKTRAGEMSHGQQLAASSQSTYASAQSANHGQSLVQEGRCRAFVRRLEGVSIKLQLN